ncbi:MAG: undecaprenyl-diphosphate phosphatase [Alphaproteobacteria bacterium]|jgi:undecaprenyl-diphosphatase|nr:undecaprenyl-diphosphate phosphatase [Alphaproteobacteria bacterium]
MQDLLLALLLGLVEGLTEFLPVSSTGHLILLGDLLGFQFPGKTFEIVIQLGAILAVCVAYWKRLWGAVTGCFAGDVPSRHFVTYILIAFLPAMLVGAFAYKYIRQLLDSPLTIAIVLIAGGIAILLIERLIKQPKVHAIEDFGLPLALKIGLFQCVSMIPGVSRSGATIMGALLMGVERKAAAEFSFFLAIPTMTAATAYKIYKDWAMLSFDGAGLIAIGFVTAFLVALLVVKAAVAFVGRHGFAPFAWYRIGFGILMLVLLLGR